MMTPHEQAAARQAMAQPGYDGPFHEHDGYAPHSHEVRADHLGVAQADPPALPPGRVARLRAEAAEAARRGDYELARAYWADATEVESTS